VKGHLLKRLAIASLISMMVLAGGAITRAQDIIGNTGREQLNRSTTGSAKSKPIYRTRTKTVYVDRNAHPTITTGTLSVDAFPNAIVRVEPVRGGTALEGTVPANERLFIFGDLKPGPYLVAATLDGYKPATQKIEIAANKHKGLTLNLQPILYTVKINTNVPSGEVRYAPVESYSEQGTTEKRYRPSGETRVVPVQDHIAVLPALVKGTYGVDIRASEVGFETKLGTVTVPDDTDKEEIKLEVTLKNVRSTETFSALTTDQWDLPGGWRIASGLLSANGKGVAIPHLALYRYYSDFILISDAKMLNGIAVSFAVRVSNDKENYYLIQFTGPNAEEPYMLSGYIVKHGVRERFQSISIGHLRNTIRPNQFFSVSIKMRDNRIEVSVADSQTGEDLPLGNLIDANRNFSIGAVGIAAGDRDQSQFGSFIVCSSECPKQ
jgi:hypothetical protein